MVIQVSLGDVLDTESRPQFDSLLTRRFFYDQAFKLYGGTAGLFDYGPPGCALQSNIIDLWRKHFVLEEDMLEVDTTILTKDEVLKTSGHVAKFADWMCKDLASGEIFRADHVIEEVLENRLKADKQARGIDLSALKIDEASDSKKKKKSKGKEQPPKRLTDDEVVVYEEILAKIDGYSGAELGELIIEHQIGNPVTGAKLSPPIDFNLMFATSIGPTGDSKGYLRPETAQGQFLNFQRLYDYNNTKMPFASASIGKSFRNEISPRSGLLRVREFLMAEIEHFVDPEKKTHPRFAEVADVKLKLLSSQTQYSGKTTVTEMTIGDAVQNGTVDNTTLGYFMARIYLFLKKLGIREEGLRFRQHMQNEMAHYASDCWDAEILSSYGWVECVGCADRSAYDLKVHSVATNASLVAREILEPPIVKDIIEITIPSRAKGPLGKKYKAKFQALQKRLENYSEPELKCALEEFLSKGQLTCVVDEETFVLTKDEVLVEQVSRQISVREFTPNVIEPSFGIGRILYSLLEHSYWTRPDDVERGVLSFPPIVAPNKVLLVPLSGHEEFNPVIKNIASKLRKAGISSKIDDSSVSIGKRYARNDEIGTPFAITVDFQTLKDQTITLRERDSTKQIRADMETILQVVRDIVEENTNWSQVLTKFGETAGQQI